MSLLYIIDAYNLFRHQSFQNKSKNQSHSLSNLPFFIKEKRLTGSSKNKVILVFDGYPHRDHKIQEGVCLDIIFSRVISADEKIKKMVEESGNRKNIIVVSDDKELRFTVKAAGALILGVEEFLAQKDQKGLRAEEEDSLSDLKISSVEMLKINRELGKIWLK